MKKKGLIISTIVMVVVLIASLTTATYAWFSASSSTTVDQIEIKIDALNAVAVGARTSTDPITTSNSQDDYMYGTVVLGHGAEEAATANNPTYNSGELGLGTELAFSTETVLTLSTGVNSASAVVERSGASAPYTAGSLTSPDATFNPRNQIYKANSGASDSAIDNTTILFANANADFVALKMGAQASQAGVKGIYATITVKTTGTASTLKMAAALHFYIRVAHRLADASEATAWNSAHSTSLEAGDLNGAYDYIEFDLFGSETRNTTKATLGTAGHVTGGSTGVVLDKADGQGTATFTFFIDGVNNKDAASALATDGSRITPFEIYAYVWGPDTDCVSTATGCGVTIDMEFFGVQAANYVGTPLTLSAEA